MAALASLDKRVSLVTQVQLALVALRDLLVVLERGVSLAVRERRGPLTTPTSG